MSEASESTPLSIIDKQSPKPTKTPAHLRKAQILALQTAGWTQERMAEHFGVNRSTIVKDLQDLQPAREELETVLSQLVTAIDSLHGIEDSALNYVELATRAKNEAVRLGAEDRISEFRGIVTEKERNRRNNQPAVGNQPMFQLAPGMSVSVTINQPNNTISSESAGLHKTPSVMCIDSIPTPSDDE